MQASYFLDMENMDNAPQNGKSPVQSKNQMQVIEWSKTAEKSNIRLANPYSLTKTNNIEHIILVESQPYAFNSRQGALTKSKKKGRPFSIISNGDGNITPQIDEELYKMAVSHKSIAAGLAELVAGNGLQIEMINPIDSSEPLFAEYQNEVVRLQDLIDNKGLNTELIQQFANDMVYHNQMCCIIGKSSPKYVGEEYTQTPISFVPKQVSNLRVAMPKTDAMSGIAAIGAHAYHENWGYYPGVERDETNIMFNILDWESYVFAINAATNLDNNSMYKVGVWLDSMESSDGKYANMVSFWHKGRKSIGDKIYPTPKWKTDSVCNDIVNEYEASCIRRDFIQNGMHAFALINVYVADINIESVKTESDDEWSEIRSVVDGLKGSFNSGKVLVNRIPTADDSLKGKIEVQKLSVDFPYEAAKYFNDESRSAILSAWGVSADLFGITKPEKNNLTSQAEFMNVNIIQLESIVKQYQEMIEAGLLKITKFFGYELAKLRIKKADNNKFIVTIRDFAAPYMTKNEIREMILGLPNMNAEQMQRIFDEQSIEKGLARFDKDSNKIIFIDNTQTP